MAERTAGRVRALRDQPMDLLTSSLCYSPSSPHFASPFPREMSAAATFERLSLCIYATSDSPLAKEFMEARKWAFE
jgi:hypothetical protein